MMDFTWYILGLLSGAVAIFLWKYSRRYKLNGFAWSGLIFGFSLILFSMAWAMGSVLEGVPRAASMGLLMFGLSGIFLLTYTFKTIDARLEKIAPDKTDKIVPESVSKEIISPKALKITKQDRIPAKSVLSTVVRYAAYVSLVVVFLAAMFSGGKDYETMVMAKFKDQKLTKVNEDPVVFQLGEKGDGPGNYVLIQEGQGYGGPFVFGIRIMEDAKVHEVIPLDHKETPAFIKKIQDAGYKDQFLGKSVSDNFIVGIDIDSVSGATVTTMAAAEAVRKGAHITAVQHFKLEPKWKKVSLKFGLDEMLILVLFILAFVPKVYEKKPWKYIYLSATIGVVGFYLNASISVGSFSGLLMGYIPGFKEHLIWWVLVVGTVLGVVFLGKNVYCFRICPFHGIQYLLTKLGGNRLNPPPAILKQSKFIVNFLLWLALMTGFLSAHPALGSFEPFAMMFSLNGVGIQWFVLPLALIGSFFMSSFWCRFFCPCGQALIKLKQFRNKLLDFVQKRKKEHSNEI